MRPEKDSKYIGSIFESHPDLLIERAMIQIKKKHPDLIVEAVLKGGRPSASITDFSENEGVDRIMMGSRGIAGYTGWILGSTSRRVVDSFTKLV